MGWEATIVQQWFTIGTLFALLSCTNTATPKGQRNVLFCRCCSIKNNMKILQNAHNK